MRIKISEERELSLILGNNGKLGIIYLTDFSGMIDMREETKNFFISLQENFTVKNIESKKNPNFWVLCKRNLTQRDIIRFACQLQNK